MEQMPLPSPPEKEGHVYFIPKVVEVVEVHEQGGEFLHDPFIDHIEEDIKHFPTKEDLPDE